MKTAAKLWLSLLLLPIAIIAIVAFWPLLLSIAASIYIGDNYTIAGIIAGLSSTIIYWILLSNLVIILS